MFLNCFLICSEAFYIEIETRTPRFMALPLLGTQDFKAVSFM